MGNVFSGGINIARCNALGLTLMGIAILILFFSKPIAERIRPDDLPRIHDRIRLTALLLCAVGALIAICL